MAIAIEHATMRATMMNHAEIQQFQRSEKRQYKALFVLTVLCFLPILAVARCVPGRRSRAGKRQSIISEARAAAESCLPFVYMG